MLREFRGDCPNVVPLLIGEGQRDVELWLPGSADYGLTITEVPLRSLGGALWVLTLVERGARYWD
jgi:hypothetical protein